jgi:hypothetical protein
VTPVQETMLRQRLVDGSADERLLNERLVGIGGDILVLLPAGWGPDPECRQIWAQVELKFGQQIDALVRLKQKEMSGCHRNVAEIWRRKQYKIAAICEGYGLGDDGLWRDHTFGIMKNGGIIETTYVHEKYFGLIHGEEMSDGFANRQLRSRP